MGRFVLLTFLTFLSPPRSSSSRVLNRWSPQHIGALTPHPAIRSPPPPPLRRTSGPLFRPPRRHQVGVLESWPPTHTHAPSFPPPRLCARIQAVGSARLRLAHRCWHPIREREAAWSREGGGRAKGAGRAAPPLDARMWTSCWRASSVTRPDARLGLLQTPLFAHSGVGEKRHHSCIGRKRRGEQDRGWGTGGTGGTAQGRAARTR